MLKRLNEVLYAIDPNFMGLWISYDAVRELFEAKWHISALSKVECAEDLDELMKRVWRRIC